MNKSIVLRIWNETEFKLYIPAKIDVNNKIEVHFLFLDPTTGKKKNIKKSSGIDRNASKKVYISQANELVESIIDLLALGWNPITNSYPDHIKLTTISKLKDCIDSWLKLRKTDFDNAIIGKNEYEITCYVFNYYQEFLRKNMILFEKPSRITINDINLFMRHLEKERKLSPFTYNSYLHRLNFFFKYLFHERIITYNPCTIAHYYKTRKLKTRFEIFEAEELQNVRNLLLNPAFKDLQIACKFIFEYNIREAEQLRIKLSWFNWSKRTLTFPEYIIENDKKVNATKNGLSAIFELQDDMISMLRNYIGERNDKNFYLFGGHNRPNLKKVQSQFLTNRWYHFRVVNNLSKSLKLYALKHTGNYDSLGKVPIEKLSQIARHSSILQTQDYVKSKLSREVIKIDGKTKF